MNNSYLGPEFSDSRIEADLKKVNLSYRKLEREPLLEAVAEQVAAGNVVGWFQGRMEWGPRALGNRSIVAHPGRPDMKDVLNARIKHREWFRPFAPSILVERQNEYFEYDHPSPFMLHVYKIRPEKREQLCAVNHVDNTGRLQTVSHEEDPLYYDLIRAFERKTGIPVILNTSSTRMNRSFARRKKPSTASSALAWRARHRPTRPLAQIHLCGGASIVLIQFLGALKVVPLTNLLVRPKAGATPMTDPSWE